MATPKLNKLAQRFMNQIQDPITIDAGVILPGVLIRSVSEIENYLGQACAKFVEQAWIQAKGNAEALLKMIPSLRYERSVTITTSSRRVDISGTHADLFDILDSRKDESPSIYLEAWDPARLSDALTGSDPFYVGTATRGGIILQRPYIYLFPESLSEGADFSFTLCFIKLALNPLTGEYLVSGGDYDLHIDEIYFPQISDIATKLYQVDDYQEDAG